MIHSNFLVLTFLTSLVTLTLANTHAHDDHYDQHGAHVHGQANASISYSGNELVIYLSVPAGDVYGFEHEPKNEQQATAKTKALETLSLPDNVFYLSPPCRMDSHNVASQQSDDQHSDMHHDVVIKSAYTCEADKSINLTFMIFESLPDVQKVKVEYLSDYKQALITLKHSNNSIKIE